MVHAPSPQPSDQATILTASTFEFPTVCGPDVGFTSDPESTQLALNLTKLGCYIASGRGSEELHAPASQLFQTFVGEFCELMKETFPARDCLTPAQVDNYLNDGWELAVTLLPDTSLASATLTKSYQISFGPDESPLSALWIGHILIAPSVQGTGIGSSIIAQLASSPTRQGNAPDIILADVANPYYLEPDSKAPVHDHSDKAARAAAWREHYGEPTDPHRRLSFWLRQGFAIPTLQNESGTEVATPYFPRIPGDSNTTFSSPEFLLLVRPTSDAAIDLFETKPLSAADWRTFYYSLGSDQRPQRYFDLSLNTLSGPLVLLSEGQNRITTALAAVVGRSCLSSSPLEESP